MDGLLESKPMFLTCRICQKSAPFVLLNHVPKGRYRIVCDTGTGFQHITKNGKHYLINTNTDDEETVAPRLELV